jgi:hypothetical protein
MPTRSLPVLLNLLCSSCFLFVLLYSFYFIRLLCLTYFVRLFNQLGSAGSADAELFAMDKSSLLSTEV